MRALPSRTRRRSDLPPDTHAHTHTSLNPRTHIPIHRALPRRMGLKEMLDANQGQLGDMMGGTEELDDFDDGEL